MRIEKLKQTFEIDTVLVHFPLHPETPAEGRSMAELYAGRNVDPEAMYARMKGLMDAEGLPYGRRTHTYNSRLAQELGKWADTQPGGAALHDKLYQAYFVEARNIGDPDLLVELASSVGLPAEEARAVLTERRFKDAVDADWAKSHQYGVSAVGPAGHDNVSHDRRGIKRPKSSSLGQLNMITRVVCARSVRRRGNSSR